MMTFLTEVVLGRLEFNLLFADVRSDGRFPRVSASAVHARLREPLARHCSILVSR
jgi:hypothetical protein